MKKTRLWTKNFILITLANFILFVSFQMLLPTLPAYATMLGGSEIIAGLIIGIFTFSAVASRPYAGFLMDQQGRKGVLVAGFLMFIVCAFLYNFAYLVVLLLMLRVVHGLGWGMATTASGTVAADVIPSTRRGEGLGYYGMSAVLSMAFAPPLGVYIMENLGFNHLFISSTILGVVALIIALGVTYDPVVKKEQQQVKPAIFEPSSFRTSSVLFFLTFIYGGVITFIVLYGNSLGIEKFSLFFPVYATFLFIIRPIAGKLSDGRGTDVVVIPGLILVTVGVIILGLAQSLEYFLASAVLIGLGFGAAQPSLQALTIKLAPPERRGAANATFFSAFDLGIGFGAIIMGALSSWIGYAGMYLFSSLAGIISLVIYWQLLYGAKGGGIPEAAGMGYSVKLQVKERQTGEK
ncbi:MAG: MFS transporter [Clostridia bacterium]|nr:MFS transporter [Clostridia bacterium]